VPEAGHDRSAPELTAPAAFRHPRPASHRFGDAGEDGPLDESNRSFEDDLKTIAAILTAGYLRYVNAAGVESKSATGSGRIKRSAQAPPTRKQTSLGRYERLS